MRDYVVYRVWPRMRDSLPDRSKSLNLDISLLANLSIYVIDIGITLTGLVNFAFTI